MSPGAVELRGPPAGRAGGGAYMSWWSEYGGLVVDGDTARLSVRLEGVQLTANMSAARLPWSEEDPDRSGPEGWLAPTGLLPCHYYVYSFASPTAYSLQLPPSPSRTRAARATLAAPLATAHIERNYGESFPTGWVWSQASATHGLAHLLLTGGRFVIGGVAVPTYIVALRAPSAGLQWSFRTTDLDQIVGHRQPCAGKLEVNATSRGGSRRLGISLSAPPRSFGRRIPVPTTAGFSDRPGCRESYTATAEIRAFARPDRWHAWGQPRMQFLMPLAVLEFGGTFQCATSASA